MSPPRDIFVKLRDQALGMHASQLGLGTLPPHAAYGVVMDLSIDDNFATVTAFATGDASVYLSTGGGMIGGIDRPSVAAAAKRFVAAANPALNLMMLAAATPLPGRGLTSFYVLTGEGTFTATASEDELGERKLSLSPLFYAGQDVLTAFRESDGK